MQNRLSVVGGKYRGSKLQSPLDARTHPMGAREKNALFNRLGNRLEQARVLDAYAGTGALAIEALSRGAKEATLVEKSAKVAKIAQQNIQNVTPNGETSIYIMSVAEFITQFVNARFDIVIADPPYDQVDAAEVANLGKLLAAEGVLVLSHPAKQPVPEFEGLELLSSRTYAGATISFYKKLHKVLR